MDSSRGFRVERPTAAWVLALLALAPPAQAGAPSDMVAGAGSMVLSGHRCAGEIEAPVSIRIEDPDSIVPGLEFQLKGSIELHADAPRLVMRFKSDGPLALDVQPLVLGPSFAGEIVPFGVPVKCGDYGNGVVHVWVEATDELGAPLFSNRGSLFARLRPEGNLLGRGGFLALESLAVETERAAGRMSAEQADTAHRELARLLPAISSDPPTVRIFTPEEQRLNELIGLPGEGAAIIGVGSSAARDDGTITVQGNAQWQDENGDWHPVWGARIDIRDAASPAVCGSSSPAGIAGSTMTDLAGNYSIAVDNDDGAGDSGLDILVCYRTINDWIDTSSTFFTYFAASSIFEGTQGGTVLTVNFDFEPDELFEVDGFPIPVGGGYNDAISVFQAATWIAAYAASDLGIEVSTYGGLAPLPQVRVVWPSGQDGSMYYLSFISIEEEDRYDWDTIHHEYGHFVLDKAQLAFGPGGPHSVGDCLVERLEGDKLDGTKLAWSEGWPTYFGTTGQIEMGMASLGVPRVGDTWYHDLEDTTVNYDLEAQDDDGLGEDNEIAIQRLLFDLYDANNDSRDTISRTDNSIWDGMRMQSHPACPLLNGFPVLSRFWNNLRCDQSDQVQLQMGGIATDHRIGPALDGPIDGALVTPSYKTFSWQMNVGCPGSYDGDDFDLVIYDAATFDKLLTVPGLPAASYTLDLAELQSLTAVTHNVLWAVEARHLPYPSTGPYLGESFAATVNQPPVADAGDDLTTECTSPATSPVQLDASGSSDPDGDPLTHSWSAPGIDFDDSTSPTPTGEFPRGTHPVALTVSDGIQQNDDMVSVMVDDSTPPEISVVLTPSVLWPPNNTMQTITADVTVQDACDPDPEVILVSITSNEATDGDIQDAEFNHDDREFRLRAKRRGNGNGRIYTVVYRATDADGNHVDATAEVSVPHDRSGER